MRRDAQALRHNLQQARQWAPERFVWAVIKAEAYGHGMLWAARTLADVTDGFAVSGMEEALWLREQGFKQPLLVLQGVRKPMDWRTAVAHSLQVVIHHVDQLRGAEQAHDQLSDLWIKVDTGMHRLGFFPSAIAETAGRLRSLLGNRTRLHWMTHLACADEPYRPENRQQIDVFFSVLQQETGICARGIDLPGVLSSPREGTHSSWTESESTHFSVANSAAILSGVREAPMNAREWIRPGLLLYGANPIVGQEGHASGLLPVMTVEAPIIALRDLEPGMSVGYGGTWTAQEKTQVATIAMGYADGYPRHAPSGTPVWVKGSLCPLVGRVSMDMLAVAIPVSMGVRVGDPVRLWGQGLPVERVASSAGTIAYELLTRVGDRLLEA